jgi:S1-C subfamily serine protease
LIQKKLVQQPSSQAATDPGMTSLGHGYLGIAVRSESVEIDAMWGTSSNGAMVSNIDPQSPAVSAGLRTGDVITKFQGMSFRSPADLLQIIRTQPPGTSVKLEVIRNNKLREISARLAERPDAGG